MLGFVDDVGDFCLNGGGGVRSGGDLAERFVGAVYDTHALTQRLLGCLNAAAQLFGAGFHIADAGVYFVSELLDLFCQFSDLFRHDGKALSLLACPCGLDGCVDGQNIGLVSDGHDLSHAFLDSVDGILQQREGAFHLAIRFLHFHGGVHKVGHHLLGV